MIVYLAIIKLFLPSNLASFFFCISDSFCKASLSLSHLFFNLLLFFYGACAILLSTASVMATPARVKGAVCRSVKVIRSRTIERTIEKTIHTYI